MNTFEHNSGKQKETIIYGGAFNPPTLGHKAILQACIDQAAATDADVWLQPSGNRNDKTIDVSKEERMRLLYALTRDVMKRVMTSEGIFKTVHVGIETSELTRDIPVETYDTVLEMNERYPNRHFRYVFGMDSVAAMKQWKEGEWLFDTLPMLVVNRPGTPEIELGEQSTLLPVDTIRTSSTEVRERLATNQPINDLVSHAVHEVLMTY